MRASPVGCRLGAFGTRLRVALTVVLALILGTTLPVQADGTATVTGTVTAADGGEVLAGISVCALPEGMSGGSCVTTGADGVYTLDVDLVTADHRLHVTDPSLTYLVQELPLTLEQDGTTTVDVELDLAGAISGEVRSDTDGRMLGNVLICAGRVSGGMGSCATTGSDGTFVLGGLSAEDHVVQSYDQTGLHFDETYDDSFGWNAWASATPVSVVAGQASVIAVSLFEKGSIAGTVTAAVDGSPLGGIDVCAEPQGQGDNLCDLTEADGTYSIDGTGPSTEYIVEFSDETGTYAGEFFDGTSRSTAALVSVSSGATVTIDADLGPSGSIAGVVVSDVDDQPLGDVEVCASGETIERCAHTDGSGAYVVSGLPLGGYHVTFDDGGAHLWEMYDDTVDEGAAQLVTISGGAAVITGIDASLAKASSVSGILTGPGADRDVQWRVKLYGGTGRAWSGDVVSGAYTVDGLNEGWYRAALMFRDDPDDDYVKVAWHGGSDEASARYFHVGSAEEVTGIDFEVPSPGSIGGIVYTSPGVVATSGTVTLVNPTNLTSAASAAIGDDGTYLLSDVDPGSYLVISQVPGHALQIHMVDDAPVVIDITSAGESRSGIDITGPVSAEVSGQVLSPDGTAFSGPFQVQLWADADVWLPTRSVSVDADQGTFSVAGMPHGTYRVRIDPWSDGPATWLGDTTVRSEATVLEIGTDTPVDPLTVHLAPEGSSLTVNLEPDGWTSAAVMVFAEGQDWFPAYSATLEGSSVTIPDVAPGRYQVRYSGLSGKTATIWHGGSKSRAGSPIVEIGTDEPVVITSEPPGPSALVEGYVIGGGRAVAGANVLVYSQSAGWFPDGWTTTRADGSFEVGGLDFVPHKILVVSPDPTLGSIWHGGAATRAEAAEISFDLGDDVDDWEGFIVLPTL